MTTQPTFHCPSCEVGWRPHELSPGWPTCWHCGNEGKVGQPQLPKVPPGMGISYRTRYALPIGA